ncbi:related to HDA1 - histone deacetylase A [Melanopsichium pennsylvanicum]|uniref:histone deacetylase n=2 Tax=Melanopsichium pennsylvanicum TaxID=63383 RepID=A0AAJ4XNT4_9BASI|nr:related to HDA1-histone deacetylase A [Melanopsichium pennsylvanicum 4]SNX85548.1 related to HDA1 - histone deacetylase A [Melanopsichium pennsylvanicum]
MPESSRTLPSTNRNQPIILDDDDDVDMATVAQTSVPSPAVSLRDMTPAVSVSTTSSSINGHTNAHVVHGAHHGAPSGTGSPFDQYRTGYVYSSDMTLHSNPIDPEHPERPLRIWQIYTQFKANRLFERMKKITIREVLEDEVRLVHDQGIWKGVMDVAKYHPDFIKRHVGMLETSSSLYVNEHSAYCARLSCGGAIELCDAIASGQILNGFAIIRPPGHHAEPHKSMGFCFFNNVAVAARVLRQKHNHIKKILILDWDVHHGNGTQRAFESDADVLYISLHRYDEDGSFYPGSTYGNYDSAGTGPGEGKSVNVPWPIAGMGDGDYLYAFHNLVMPIAHEFAPDFVIISAGFDAARGDPIGENTVSPGGFAQMTHLLNSLCQGKVAVILEGGYNPEAVANSAVAVTDVLLSLRTAEPEDTIASTIAAETVKRVRRFHSKYWKSLKITDTEADDYDADSINAPPSVEISELLAEYRRSVITREYELFEIPLYGSSAHSKFAGDVLCSENILGQYPTIVFFVHDMGNLRSEKPRPSRPYGKEGQLLVDASRRILDWAKSRGYGIVDMNMIKEFSAIKPNAPAGQQRKFVSAEDIESKGAACRAAAFVWDNVVALARSAGMAKNVIMIGLGSGCNVLTSLVDQRDVESNVRAVVNVVGYDEMPHVSLGSDLARKKWYYQKSKVLAPADHRHLLERGDAAPLKRFGKIQPIKDVAAINILTSHMDEITSFVDKKIRIANTAAASNSN